MSRMTVSIPVRNYDLNYRHHIANEILLRYFEESRWHSIMESDGLGIGELFRNGVYSVVRSQAMEVFRPARQGETLHMTSWIDRVGKTSFTIGQEASSASGELIARARVTVVHLHGNGTPREIPKGLLNALPEDSLQPLYLRLSHEAPEDASAISWPALSHEIDMFQHVNHAMYASRFNDARILFARRGDKDFQKASAQTAPRCIFLEYQREAVLGDDLTVQGWAGEEEDAYDFLLTRDKTLLCRGKIIA